MRITFFWRKTPDLTAAFQILHVFLKAPLEPTPGWKGPGGPGDPLGGFLQTLFFCIRTWFASLPS